MSFHLFSIHVKAISDLFLMHMNFAAIANCC